LKCIKQLSNIEKNRALRDPAVRRACRDNPDQALDTLRARGFDLPDLGREVEIRMVFNTAHTTHWVMPIAVDDGALADGDLSRVQAAGSTASTVASAGSLASYGTLCSTSSTASTASSAGTVGCVTDE